MIKIQILKKDQKSSLDFFLSKIQKTFCFLKFTIKFKFNKYLKIKAKKRISHNQIFFLPFFFDIVFFIKKSKQKKSIFVHYLKKKIKNKKKFLISFLKIKKLKEKKFFNLYLKFISFTFKMGKKFFWENVFANIFNNLALKYKYSRSFILSKIFIRLYTRVELKKVQSRKRISYIPFFINLKRSLFLALKWIFLSVKNNNTKISTADKIFLELSQILSLSSCASIKKLQENNIYSFQNRSNVYYRWD